VPALREIQAALGQALLGGEEGPAAALVRGDGLEPAARLEIYRHHVFTTLTAALSAAFPVVCRLVDERFFSFAADRYIRVQPPDGPCLFEYGASLPDFLADFEACRHLRYLPDVARLEWALHAAVFAEDAAPMDPAALHGVPAEDLAHLVLRLDPSLALVASPWPIDRIWRANQPDADPGVTVDLAAGGVRLEVRRLGDDPVFRLIDAPTFAFRRALLDGDHLEAAATAALEEDAAFDLTAAIRALFAETLPVGFAVSKAGGESG
jgi:hypothetical protein